MSLPQLTSSPEMGKINPLLSNPHQKANCGVAQVGNFSCVIYFDDDDQLRTGRDYMAAEQFFDSLAQVSSSPKSDNLLLSTVSEESDDPTDSLFETIKGIKAVVARTPLETLVEMLAASDSEKL